MTSYTRREFAGLVLLGLPTAHLLSAIRPRAAGVQIGLNVPYSFGNTATTGDEILKACLAVGVGAVELRSQPVEAFLGAPEQPARGGRGADSAARAAAIALARSAGERLKEWRLTAAPEKAGRSGRSTRTPRDDRHREFDNIYAMSEASRFASGWRRRSVPARSSCEISAKDDDLRRVGSFADSTR